MHLVPNLNKVVTFRCHLHIDCKGSHLPYNNLEVKESSLLQQQRLWCMDMYKDSIMRQQFTISTSIYRTTPNYIDYLHIIALSRKHAHTQINHSIHHHHINMIINNPQCYSTSTITYSFTIPNNSHIPSKRTYNISWQISYPIQSFIHTTSLSHIRIVTTIHKTISSRNISDQRTCQVENGQHWQFPRQNNIDKLRVLKQP